MNLAAMEALATSTSSVADKPGARASALAEELLEEAKTAGPVVAEGGLTEQLATTLQAAFGINPVGVIPGAAASNGRGGRDYWFDHGALTGSLMAYIAARWGGNPDLYRRVGLIHDADYLAHPHDAPGTGDRHPVPLVRAMRAAGVHTAICRAVLEHAPYVRLDRHPTSRLSAALSVAEDLATLAALEPASKHLDELSVEARVLFDRLRPRWRICREGSVRVERDVERFVNLPLRLIVEGYRFAFSV